jgi:hypothetical protein
MRLAEAWVEAALTFNGVRHFVGGYTEAKQLRNARQSFSRALRRPAQPAQGDVDRMRDALTQAEACMSIVEPRSDKAEYVRILGVIRAALSALPAVKQRVE